MLVIDVVCGVITNNDKILICKRKSGLSMAGYWEFPGGKIKPKELPDEALIRELYEELGMKVTINNHFKTIVHSYGDFTIKLIAYKCTFIKASFILTDHDEYKWVEVIELHNWELAEADVLIAQALKEVIFN